MPERRFVEGKMPVIIDNIRRSDLAALTTALEKILSTLSTHPLMADPPSSHLTPAPLFHIYDFIERTRCNLGGISVAKLSANEKDALENWNDCVGRCDMARLMLDDKTGKAAELLGGKVDLGEKVREAVLRAAVVAGNVGSAVDVRVGRISTNVTGKHKNT